ncbi:MAG: hypothetical protein K6F15_08645 [Treponema sp.]|nr:hypothetical protein [Treponema sp.]
MKKILSFVLAATLLALGFSSCSESSDDNNTALLLAAASNRSVQIVADVVEASEAASFYGTYYGIMTVMTTTKTMTIVVAADSVNCGAGYGTYTKVLWLKDSNGNYIQASQSDSKNASAGDLTKDNFTSASSCYIIFANNGTATYVVPAMAVMGGSVTITNRKNYCGTYSGSMTVMGNTVSLTATVAEDSITLSGGYGTYNKVLWTYDSSNKLVFAGQSDSKYSSSGALTSDNYTTASSCYLTFDSTSAATLVIPAMASMGGTATITK